jgi:hypothetical protein
MLNMNKSLRLKAKERFWEEQKIRKGIKEK